VLDLFSCWFVVDPINLNNINNNNNDILTLVIINILVIEAQKH
jgi:hypothetical protein